MCRSFMIKHLQLDFKVMQNCMSVFPVEFKYLFDKFLIFHLLNSSFADKDAKLTHFSLVHNLSWFDIFSNIRCRHQPHFSRLANWEGIEKVDLLYKFTFITTINRITKWNNYSVAVWRGPFYSLFILSFDKLFLLIYFYWKNKAKFLSWFQGKSY